MTTSMHYNFLQDFIASSKLNDNIVTIVPTLVFLWGMFFYLFQQLHRHTTQYTRWQTRLYRDLVFHWIYFYVSRIWFVIMRFFKWTLSLLDQLVEETMYPEEVNTDKTLIHLAVFIIVLIVASLPLLSFAINNMRTESIPNFLVWVGEDPWLRSEIGISGHYLDRPASVPSTHYESIAAYRCRRSTSFDRIRFKCRKPWIRSCRSMQLIH